MVYSDTQVLPLGAPYIPGYLGFREVPAYMELIERLRQHDGGRLVPQVRSVHSQLRVLLRSCAVVFEDWSAW